MKGGPRAHKTADPQRWFYSRLRERVVRAELGPCLEWTGKLKHGYGRVTVDYETKQAHRVAWELAHGPVPEGMQVCHKCDNPACCNVEHLFVGTVLDNNQDATRKGRHHNQRLTAADYARARELRTSGATHQKIADELGITQSYVWRVLSRDYPCTEATL